MCWCDSVRIPEPWCHIEGTMRRVNLRFDHIWDRWCPGHEMHSPPLPLPLPLFKASVVLFTVTVPGCSGDTEWVWSCMMKWQCLLPAHLAHALHLFAECFSTRFGRAAIWMASLHGECGEAGPGTAVLFVVEQLDLLYPAQVCVWSFTGALRVCALWCARARVFVCVRKYWLLL